MLHGNNAEKTIHSFTLFHSQPQIASIPKNAQHQRLNCVSTLQERSTLTVDLQIAPTRSLWRVPIDRSIIGRSLTPQTSPEARPLGLRTSSHTLRGIWEEDLGWLGYFAMANRTTAQETSPWSIRFHQFQVTEILPFSAPVWMLSLHSSNIPFSQEENVWCHGNLRYPPQSYPPNK